MEATEEVVVEKIPKKLWEHIDAVYLILGFLPRLMNAVGDWNREKADDTFSSTHGQELIKDVIKYENQVSLKLLHQVVANVENAVKATKDDSFKNLDRADPLISSIEKYKFGFDANNFHVILCKFCWYYSPFSFKETSPGTVLEKELLSKSSLLECLHFCLTAAAEKEDHMSMEVWRIPNVRKLVRSGVQLEPGADRTLQIEFSSPVLRIPALICDFKLETVLRNLLAWECLHCDDQKPVTRYTQLLSELVEGASDVKLMQKAGVIRLNSGGNLGSRQALDIIKRIGGHATYPSACMPMDHEIEKVRNYHDVRMKSFLVRSRPAIMWGSIAAASAASVFLSQKLASMYGSRKRGASSGYLTVVFKKQI